MNYNVDELDIVNPLQKSVSWNESEHPRQTDGKFGNKAGAKTKAKADGKSAGGGSAGNGAGGRKSASGAAKSAPDGNSKGASKAPVTASDFVTLFHGTGIVKAETIQKSGFKTNWSGNGDMGKCAYFKSPEWDGKEADNFAHTARTVNYFAGDNRDDGAVFDGRVIRAVIPKEHVLDCSNGRPAELQAMIDATRYRGLPNGAPRWDKKSSPYEAYAKKHGIKAIVDKLDTMWEDEGWQIGVYDPKIIQVMDVGKRVAGAGASAELLKSLGMVPYCLMFHEFDDDNLILHVGAHGGDELQKGINDYDYTERAVALHRELERKLGIPASGREARYAYSLSHTTDPSEVLYIPVNRLKMVYQTDEATNWDKVKENMDKMQAGEALEPVVIGYDYDVHDGHHRWIAAKGLEHTHVPCVVGGTNDLRKTEAMEQYRELWKSMDKLEGGKWVTVEHRHVYIKGGKVVAGHLPNGDKMEDHHIKESQAKVDSGEHSQSKHLEHARKLAGTSDNYADWAIGLHHEHAEVHEAVKTHMAATGKKYKDLYAEWDGGKSVEEWKPDSTKKIEDVEVGTAKFEPSEVKVSHRTDGRTALASAPTGATIQVHNDLLAHDKDTQKYVIAHEVGHILSNAYPALERHVLENPQGALGRYNQKRMFFDGVAHTPEESWADAFSHYHTDPEWLKDKHPKAYEFVDKLMPKIPKAKQYLDEAFKQLDKMNGGKKTDLQKSVIRDPKLRKSFDDSKHPRDAYGRFTVNSHGMSKDDFHALMSASPSDTGGEYYDHVVSHLFFREQEPERYDDVMQNRFEQEGLHERVKAQLQKHVDGPHGAMFREMIGHVERNEQERIQKKAEWAEHWKHVEVRKAHNERLKGNGYFSTGYNGHFSFDVGNERVNGPEFAKYLGKQTKPFTLKTPNVTLRFHPVKHDMSSDGMPSEVRFKVDIETAKNKIEGASLMVKRQMRTRSKYGNTLPKHVQHEMNRFTVSFDFPKVKGKVYKDVYKGDEMAEDWVYRHPDVSSEANIKKTLELIVRATQADRKQNGGDLQKSVVLDPTGNGLDADPNIMFRGIGQKELDFIQKNGFVQSKGKGNDADQGKVITCFTQLFMQAEGYARSNYTLYGEQAAYVIALPKPPWVYENDAGELESDLPVPFAFSMIIPIPNPADELQKALTPKQVKAVHKDLPPGGTWRTMHNGHHIYIVDGKVVAGAVQGASGAKKATKAQLAEHQEAVTKEAKAKPKAKTKPKAKGAKANELRTVPKKAGAARTAAKADAGTGRSSKKPAGKPAADVGAKAGAKPKKPDAPKAAGKSKAPKKAVVADVRTEGQTGHDLSYDVGERVFGSRKDLAQLRNELNDKISKGQSVRGTLAGLEKIDPGAAKKYCTKENILQKHDWHAQHKQGVDLPVAMVKKMVLDRIQPKPDKDDPETRRQYAHAIEELHRLFAPVKTMDDLKAVRRSLQDRMRLELPKHLSDHQSYLDYAKKQMTIEPKTYDLEERVYGKDGSVTHKPITVKQLRKKQQERVNEIQAKIDQWHENAKNPYHVLGEKLTNFFTDGDSANNTIKTVMSKNPKWEDYLDPQDKTDTAKPKKNRKAMWERRIENPNARSGGRAGTVQKPEDAVKQFGLRGVQFGHWVDDTSGKFHLLKASEALQDMADTLGMKDKDVSLNGRLALAFGARGIAGMGAAAHYEPDLRVINLTKEGGAGSLAHEWGHALDDIMASHSGIMGYASESPNDIKHPEVRQAFSELVDAIHKGDGSHTGTVQVPNQKKMFGRYYPSRKKAVHEAGRVNAEMVKKFTDDINERFAKDKVLLERYASSGSESAAKKLKTLDSKRKRETNELHQELMYHLSRLTGEDVPHIDVPTEGSEYLNRMKELDGEKSKPYYSTGREMFARVFESWMEHQLASKGNKNHYLVGGTSEKMVDAMDAPFPKGTERKHMFDKMGKLMKAVVGSGEIKKALDTELGVRLVIHDLQKSFTSDKAD